MLNFSQDDHDKSDTFANDNEYDLFHLDDEEIQSPLKRRKKQRLLLLLTFLLMLCLIAATVMITHPKVNSSTSRYQYEQATMGDLATTISATGSVEGDIYDADFSPNGNIAEIDVKVGEHVTKGQVLARLDRQSVQSTLNPTGIATVDTNQLTLNAPHGGIITAINGTVGSKPETMQPAINQPGDAAFMQIVDLSTLRIKAQVNESDIGKVAAGEEASFTVSSYGEQTFDGLVSAILPLGQSTASVVTYPVIINVDMAAMRILKNIHLLPNMTANVTITTVKHTHVLLLENNAITFAQQIAEDVRQNIIAPQQIQQAQKKANHLLGYLRDNKTSNNQDIKIATFVLQNVGGKLKAVPIVCGDSDGTITVIRTGLAAGDKIIAGIK